MISALLLYGLVARHSILRFRVSHHVELPQPVMSLYGVNRNGTAVGGVGFSTHSMSRIEPFIVEKGKLVVIKNYFADDCEVVARLKNHHYEVWNDKLYEAKIHNHWLYSLGILTSKPSVQVFARPVETSSVKPLDRVFPAPEGKRDTVSINSAFWWKYLERTKLIQVEMIWGSELAHRVGLKTADGYIKPLEKYVPELANYQVIGLHYIDPTGWILVSAVNRKSEARPGFGNELFWLEPRQ